MSLFQSREWWSVLDDGPEAGNEELPLSISIQVAPFPKALNSNADVIVTGSLTGFLKVYEVLRQEGDGIRTSGPSNLLLEKQMDDPIIDLALGKLTSSGDSDPKIALLHPRKVAVFSVQPDKSNKNYKLTLQYQHNLSRSAYSMVIGHFGGSKRDIICVQSLDGSINIFEQESFTFSRFLPGFLLPGPIVYVERTDSFITVTSSLQIESFRYQALAVADDNSMISNDATRGSNNNNNNKSDDITVGRKIVPDWVIGLGETTQALQIVNSQRKEVPSTIMVLGERSLCAILDTGTVVFMKKLDFTPLCMLCYKLDNQITSVVATDTATLLIFQDTSLKWASKLPFPPVKLLRGSFKKEEKGQELLRDLLVLASEKSDIFVSYLGTNPAIFTAPAPAKRELNYEETDKEYSSLTQTIRDMQSKPDVANQKQLADDLRVTLEVQKSLDRCYHETLVKTNEGIPMAKVVANFRASVPLSKVRVTFSVERPLVMLNHTTIISSLTDSEKVEGYAYLFNDYTPHSLEVKVAVVFFNSLDVPHVINTSVHLPLRLVVQPCPPIKDADFKVTISTNKPAVSLLDLFAEFVLESNMANAVGFQFYGGPFVTVLSSKTSQRYRLQSDNLPALWLLTDEIEKRLKNIHKTDLQCSYNASLPMHEYFSEIEVMFHKRSKLANLLSELSNRTAQFRSIERRLLARFRDKTPTPLTNLDTLLEGTYRQIVLAAEAVEECQRELGCSSANLASITKLLLMLARLSTGISLEEQFKLESALSSMVHLDQEQGWHETTDAALTFLLRTSLAKPGKENQGATPITLDMPKDTARLKKHITTVLDRISKGGRIVDTKNAIEASKLAEFEDRVGLDENDDAWSEMGDTGESRIGSQFGEQGERLRSARARGMSAGLSRQQNVQMPRVLTKEEQAQEQEVEDSIRNEDEGEERKEEEDEEEREQEEEVGDASPQDEYDIGW